MKWSYNMDEAPKGEYKEVPARNGSVRKVFVPEKILAAHHDGELVTISNWIPEQERWNMFSKDAPPIAWSPWPDHPGANP